MKTTTHKTITRLAIELCKNEISDDLFNNRCKVIQGSEDEDISDKKKRATNWHFYRANGSPIPKKIKKLGINFNPTSKEILKERIKRVKPKDSKKYNYLGRVLHHIQDMSTPSHVMPIYHGPKVPLYISFKMIDDHFESFMERNDCRISTKGIFELPNINNDDTFEKIYEDTANDMLKNILKVDEGIEVKDRPYNNFWKHHTQKEFKKIKGFGVYGKCHTYFKKNSLPKNNPENINMKDLYDIQDKITTHSIIATCKALLVADKILRSNS